MSCAVHIARRLFTANLQFCLIITNNLISFKLYETMIVLVVICIALGVYWMWKQRQRKTDEPPATSGGWPLIGHAHLLVGDSIYLWNSLNDLAKKSYSIGGVVSASIGPRTIYVVTDPDDALTVANTCLEKDRFYNFAKPWLGESLVTGTLPIWKVHRKLLQPAFSQVVLDGFMEVFNSQSRKLVKDLEVEAGKGPFDHWKYTKHNALETICLTVLGVDFRDHTVLNQQYVDAAEKIFYTLVDRFQKFWLHTNFMFQFSGVKRTQDECLKIVHNMSETVLQRRKSAMKNKATSNDNYYEKVIGKIKLKPFLDLLLELAIDQGVFTDQEIRDHVDTMIVGGHDTSANVLMFTLMLIGSHPEVQKKVLDELEEVFEGSDRDVEKLDLIKLVYLEAVLKESMRLYSIVPVTARWLNKDVKLKNSTLSAGRTCFIFVFGIHRHPSWGADADEFKPERWLDPSKLPESSNAFAAFMIGRRTCIGKSYAYMSMKTTLAHVLRHYRIAADLSDLVLKIDVMLKPASGYFISIEKRNRTVQ